MITTPECWLHDSRTHSWAAAWPRVLLLRRSVSSPSSPTQPSERASESCLPRTARRLLLSSHETVASTSWTKTMKCWWLASVRRESPREIFQVSDSKSWVSRAFLCWLSTRERRKRSDRSSIFNWINPYLSHRCSIPSNYLPNTFRDKYAPACRTPSSSALGLRTSNISSCCAHRQNFASSIPASRLVLCLLIVVM